MIYFGPHDVDRYTEEEYEELIRQGGVITDHHENSPWEFSQL